MVDVRKKVLGVFSSEFASSLQQFSSLSDMALGLASMPSFLLVPEQEVGAVTSGASPSDIDAMLKYVYAGGTLVLASTGDSNALTTQNELFGWNISGADCSALNTSLDEHQASGTSFAWGPATLPPLDAMRCVNATSLPDGSQSIYYYGSAVSVFRAAVGAGSVIGLAPDWNQTSIEWSYVLMMAVQRPADCEEGCQAGTYYNGSGPRVGKARAARGVGWGGAARHAGTSTERLKRTEGKERELRGGDTHRDWH